jgi:hypothetical protein
MDPSEGERMNKKKQRLVAVRITTAPGTTGESAITPVGGESLDEILADWRIVHMLPLGTEGEGPEYAALLLLEEAPSEASLGRLGFGQP